MNFSTIDHGFTQQEDSIAKLDQPLEAVCGANRLSSNYASGLRVAVYQFGSGRFIVNTLRVRENLGQFPAAERILRNMLNYASRDVNQPLADPPTDIAAQLEAIGY